MEPLYQIADEYRCMLEKSVDAETGEIDEDKLYILYGFEDRLEEKMEAVASYIQNLKSEREGIRAAVASMTERNKRLSSKIDYLTDYLKSNMIETGKEKLSYPNFEVKVKLCPISVDIIDEGLIPEEYKSVKEVVSINKLAIKAALASGKEVPGADFITNTRLEIK